MSSSKTNTLYYIHDPMCSWCWGFKPVLEELLNQLPDTLCIKYLLGGLAADSQQAMADDMQQFLQQTWHRIQQKIPATEFNFNFWKQCQPRRSTYPACRAVIAARIQQPDCERQMIDAIQQAYYLNASNPSDDNVLIELAGNLKLDLKKFKNDLNSAQTQMTLTQEIQRSQALGAQGFPSLILSKGKNNTVLRLDYNHVDSNLKQLIDLL
ncbi:MAG: DsbA family protein [Gammaproteobacteria bacterium]|nr:DsbA family protein [Gammaproteobacteria bacterium]